MVSANAILTNLRQGSNFCEEQNKKTATMKLSRVAFISGSLQQVSMANGVSLTLLQWTIDTVPS
jgi:hypothetical protein